MPEEQRVAMITGGNSGIGFAVASKLAASGFHVILASRNQQSSAKAMERMRQAHPQASVEFNPPRPGFPRRGAAVRRSIQREGLPSARADQQRRRVGGG